MEIKQLEDLLMQKLQITNIATFLNDKSIYHFEYNGNHLTFHEEKSKINFIQRFIEGVKNKEKTYTHLRDIIISMENGA